MTKIEKFEDIEAWKKGRQLATDIYTVTGKGDFAGDYGLRDQIRRASVSIVSNIGEGFSRKQIRNSYNSCIPPKAQHLRCKANYTLRWT